MANADSSTSTPPARSLRSPWVVAEARLVRLQAHLRKLEPVTSDAVAYVVFECLLDRAGLDRYAEDAQLLLVAVEHPVEGVVAHVVVRLDRLADSPLADEGARDQQADREVHQPF